MIRNEDLICQSCAIKAGLVKTDGDERWYIGKHYEGEPQCSAFETDVPCVVCGAKQGISHPLIEVEYLRVIDEGEHDAEERTSI